jgi:alanine dehydrogenase
MNIGIPKERRSFEFRVGMTPNGVQMLVHEGHPCFIEHNAGMGAGFTDEDYIAAGGRIVYSAHEVFGRADLVTKVARPTYEELEWLRPGTIIAGLLHLGSSRRDKVDILVEKEITAISFEHIQKPEGNFPVRNPLSQIGGLLSAQIAATLLQNTHGGKGILLGGAPGVPPAEVVIIGAGVVGKAALNAFLGMGAHVTVIDKDLNVLQQVFEKYPGIVTMMSYSRNIARACAYADVVVGSILVPNATPPIIITREIVRSMKPRSIIMDISIDEGGCVETSRPTNHEHPTFIEEEVIHYCVPNIPSLVARTSTYAYLNAALPYVMDVARKGLDKAIDEDPALDKGIAAYKGELRRIAELEAREPVE